MSYRKTEKTERLSAGRILIVGSQGGGKTALASKLASITDDSVQYREEFGGTIETEYFRLEFGDLFALMLPIGGQEKWSTLRTAYGETAEGIITVMDSTTKGFWPSSVSQAMEVSPVIPYENYPIGIVITKQDLNVLIREHLSDFSRAIVNGINNTLADAGISYHSRGYKIVERFVKISSDNIPFSIAEQIVVNALEKEFFTQVVPGRASEGTQLLKGFSLVNCRLFSRALVSYIALIVDEEKESRDQQSFLRLLNDMRPTLLELDTTWESLERRYPLAGKEPFIHASISEKEIEDIILQQLLAEEHDIEAISSNIRTLGRVSGWAVPESAIHVSIFNKEHVIMAANYMRQILNSIQEAKPAQKFNLLDPLEEIF
ncbi:MAG: ADP-ribosylation factor-like protein [Promethearchaeota archaeon]